MCRDGSLINHAGRHNPHGVLTSAVLDTSEWSRPSIASWPRATITWSPINSVSPQSAP